MQSCLHIIINLIKHKHIRLEKMKCLNFHFSHLFCATANIILRLLCLPRNVICDDQKQEMRFSQSFWMTISETTRNWKIFQIPWLLKTKVHTITHVQATHADSSYHLFRCGKVVFIHLKILPLKTITSKFVVFIFKKCIILFWWSSFLSLFKSP